MKKLLLTFFGLLLLSSPTLADNLIIENAWARATPGMAKAGAAFLTIKNMGTMDTVIGAKADVSKLVELHTHQHENGIMKMREVKTIEVPEKGIVEFKPGGLHIMFIGLNAPLKAGSSFPVTVLFEKGGEKTVQVAVKEIGHMGHSAHEMKKEMKQDEHHHHGHKH